MFLNERQDSGLFGLVGLGGLIAVWLAVAAVMVSVYRQPPVSPDRCELVCKPVTTSVKG